MKGKASDDNDECEQDNISFRTILVNKIQVQRLRTQNSGLRLDFHS